MLRSLDAARLAALLRAAARPARSQPARAAAGLRPGPRRGVAAERLSAVLNALNRPIAQCVDVPLTAEPISANMRRSTCSFRFLRRIWIEACAMANERYAIARAAREAASRRCGRSAQQLRAARAGARRGAAGHRRLSAHPPGYLAALEDGDVAAMPGRPYALGLPAQLRRLSGTRRQAAGCAAETTASCTPASHRPARAPERERAGRPWLCSTATLLLGALHAATI